ncbi:Palmitoyl-monogalactosyldiacylglycerol delta-7 desaturase, chloroplastic [Linum grandiflorum]
MEAMGQDLRLVHNGDASPGTFLAVLLQLGCVLDRGFDRSRYGTHRHQPLLSPASHPQELQDPQVARILLRLPWRSCFSACCLINIQGDPIFWVSNHRFHHQYSDTRKDPHSPVLGFWYSHMCWIFNSGSIKEKIGKRDNVSDLENQAFYRWIRYTYSLHAIGLAILLYAIGGFPYIVYGMGFRVVIAYHATWLVNSAGHTWGTRLWKTNDLSRNNWWVAIMTFGEGWHNNHHAFNYSAKHGLEWWQIDVTWYLIKFLESLGLAYDVKLPSLAQMHKLAIKD